jgi:hypothetical protein
MWRRSAFLTGVLLIGVAIAAVPSGAVVQSYVGGSAVHGFVEDGRYFVEPKHGQPIVEVSESTWRTVYWVERLWPFSAVIPCWVGMFLIAYGKGPDWKPPPAPPKKLPDWMVWTCGLAGVFVVVATALFWYAVRIPWATMLAGWILMCVTTGTIVWFFSRSLRRTEKKPS